jgi:outer membrane protein OmpA-like peptidoglycan-associated protein
LLPQSVAGSSERFASIAPVSTTLRKERTMQKKLIVLLIGSLLATPSFAAPKNRAAKAEVAEQHSAKEEAIGLGSGAAIGAIAGGPVGLLVGAAFGGWLGDRFHSERSARRDADERAAQASVHADSLQQLLVASERAVAEKDAALFSERVAHRRNLQEALSVELYFRTEESGLAGATEDRLARLAALIAPMDGAVIRLEGHTDARGTETFNAHLSTARAEAVRDALIRGGMPSDRVIVAAAGETTSSAPEQDVDGMALERRVEMNVVDVDAANRVAEAGSN